MKQDYIDYDQLKTFIRWVLAALIDGLFLIVWALTQYGVNWVVSRLSLSDVDYWVFLALQFLFAITTLAPIVFYIYQDIAVMMIRTQRNIRRERRVSD